MNIINADDIRAIRSISVNINDIERIATYIEEAEKGVIIERIGAAVYKNILDDPSTYADVLNPLFYDSNKKFHAGLKAAISYVAYSLFIRNQSVNVTAFGVVTKLGDFSEPASEKTIVRMANESENLGLNILKGVIEYMKFINLITSCGTVSSEHRITVIGD